MVKAVLFDLDGTLYDRDAFVRELLAAQFELFQAALGSVTRRQFVQRLIELDAHGHGSGIEIFQEAAREWGLPPEVGRRLGAWRWEADGTGLVGNSPPGLRLPADTRRTLEALCGAGKKTGVITNGASRRQRRKLELLGIEPLFDIILISESEGVRKPDPEIFRRAIRRLEVEAGEAIFVGDHPEADIAGARAAGLFPIWKFVPYWGMELEGVPTVRQLTEILPYCLADRAGH